MQDRFVPPLSPFEPPPFELVLHFLEAVKEATPAFVELRDEILPQFIAAPTHVLDQLNEWHARWHLTFPNLDLSNKVEMFVYNVLHFWRDNIEARSSLAIDMNTGGGRKRADDKKRLSASVSQWSPYREDFSTYSTRIRGEVELFLQEQKRAGEQELARFGLKPYRKRDKGRSPMWDYEWLALSVCKGLTDGQIARMPKYRSVQVQTVKKARHALAVIMQMTGSDDS